MGNIEFPKYKCYKEVWALKIQKVIQDPIGNTFLVPDDKRFENIPVDVSYVEKHKPEAGGYYVMYKDGYTSFSPAKAFEDGYTLI